MKWVVEDCYLGKTQIFPSEKAAIEYAKTMYETHGQVFCVYRMTIIETFGK